MIEEKGLKIGKVNGGRLKLIELKRYKVVQCPNCGKIGTSMAVINYKCIYCGKSRKIKKKNDFGLSVKVLKDFDDPRECGNYCRIAKDAYENKGKLIEAGFYSVSEIEKKGGI